MSLVNGIKKINNGGNMKFYRCLKCGKVIHVLNGDSNNVCCDREMLEINDYDKDASLEKHVPVIEKLDNTYKITVGEMLHPMDIDHYIMWIMIGNEKCEYFHYLVPGEVPIIELPIIANATVYAYCNKHGLFSKKID